VAAPAPAKPAKAKGGKGKKDAGAGATEEKKVENLSLDPNSVVEPIKIIKARAVRTCIAESLTCRPPLTTRSSASQTKPGR
jgi:hypothetical protein